MTITRFLKLILKLLSNESEIEEGEAQPPEPINWCVMPAQKVYQFLYDNDLEYLGCRDKWYSGIDIETWQEWAFEALQGCPEYQTESETQRGFDCDDFAEEYPAYCKRTYMGNAVWAVWGQTSQGYHAWNVVWAADGWYELEPQTGEVWVFGTNPNYQADKRL